MAGTVAAAGPRSVAVAGDVVNSIVVTGDGNTFNVRVDGDDALLAALRPPVRTPLPRPVHAVPPPDPLAVGRAAEAAALPAAAEVWGEADAGKTVLALGALDAPAARALLPDGVVYVRARGLALRDVLQHVLDALVEQHPPAALTEPVLRRELAGVRALVVADGHELDRADARDLRHALPGCHVVLVARDRVLHEGAHVAVGGLPEADWLAIAAQELGRPATAAERESLAVHGGHPWRVRRAAAELREAPAAAAGAEAAVVERLAAAGGAWVSEERLLDVASRADLQALVARRVIVQGSPKYRLPGAPAATPQATVALARDLASWAGRARARPATLATDLDAIEHVVRTAPPAEALALARAADAGFAHAGRLGAWERVLERARDHARALGDPAAEAWALHQLGTRAAALDDPRGVALLHDALALRERLGDPAAAATRHNIDVLRGGGGGDDAGDPPPRPRPGRVLAVVGAACVAGLVAAVVAAGGEDPSPPETTTEPPTTTETQPSTETQPRTETQPSTETQPTRTDPRPAVLHRLTVRPTGKGVVLLPGDRACPPDCTADVEEGDAVTLRADPQALVRWGGVRCRPAAPCTFAMAGPRAVGAAFAEPVVTVPVTVTLEGSGTVARDGTPVECAGTCTLDVPRGTPTTLVFGEGPGHYLVAVEGAGCDTPRGARAEPVCAFTPTGPTTVAATFAPVPG